jgi:hypothetical protein
LKPPQRRLLIGLRVVRLVALLTLRSAKLLNVEPSWLGHRVIRISPPK